MSKSPLYKGALLRRKVDMRSGEAVFKKDETLLAGILNLTPDSFSDGGRYMEEGLLRCVERMIEEGADMIISL